MKILDIPAVIICIIVIIFVFMVAYTSKTGNKKIHITSQNSEYYYNLQNPQKLTIQGPLGPTTVVIESNTVRIIDSPCPLKICVKQGRISNPHEWVACLPNSILIDIEGDGDEEIDSISK
jgi:hypothetical protein